MPIETDFIRDRRRLEAEILAQALFDEIADILPRETTKEVFYRLSDALLRNGVLLVRDSERGRLGLEPCDAHGWTPSDRLKFERDRIAAMTAFQRYVQFNPAGELRLAAPSDTDALGRSDGGKTTNGKLPAFSAC